MEYQQACKALKPMSTPTTQAAREENQLLREQLEMGSLDASAAALR